MPALTSIPYPSAVKVVMALLGDIATVRMAPPPDYNGDPLITVRRIGGEPNYDDDTDAPILLVSCYAPTYLAADDLAGRVQVRILSSPCTEVAGVLIDSADIHVGGLEGPEPYPDERAINSTYVLSWRRPFRP